jgi:hypothetical protein
LQTKKSDGSVGTVIRNEVFMGTVIVGAIVLAIVILIVSKMIRDKKNGKSPNCGGDCKHCGGHCDSL